MLGKKRGEITVFLTLILVLIMALVGTMIEVARINVAKVVSERALITAMDSAASEYSLPLFKEYHLLLLDLGYDSKEMNEERAIDQINESMEYTFTPAKDLSFLGTTISPNRNLLKITPSNTAITEKTSITDYNGELFMNQAIQYSKYKDLTEMIEQLLQKLKLLQSTKASTTLLKEKLKVDDKLLSLDKYNIELMESIDGIEFKKSGIWLTSNGRIKTKDYFVKKIVAESISKESVGINHNDVFHPLEDKYVNVTEKMNKIEKHMNRIEEILKEVKSLEEQLKSLLGKRDGLVSSQVSDSNGIKKNPFINSWSYGSSKVSYKQAILAKVSKKDSSKTKKEKEEEDKRQEEIDKLDEEIASISKSIDDLNREKKALVDKVNNHVDDLNKLPSEILTKIDSALSTIGKIEQKKEGILSSITEYESLLESKKNDVDKEMYDNLSEDTKNSKEYFDKTNSNNNYATNLYTLKELLNQNKSIISKVRKLNLISKSPTEEELTQMNTALEHLMTMYQGYHTKDLKFDYSELVLDSNVKNPITSFFNLMTKGVLELVLDDVSVISKKKLDVDSLYSQHEGSNNSAEGEQKESSDISGNLESSYDNSSLEDILTSFDDYENNSDLFKLFEGVTTTAMNKLLFQQYLLRHFKNMKFEKGEYSNTSKSEDNKSKGEVIGTDSVVDDSTKSQNSDSVEYVKTLKSALEYEQEYIITGKKSDEENFNSITDRIMLIRTILNFIYIMSDKARCNTARTTAMALVGFTGLAGLVQFTKILILLVWSYEESLVDLRALLYDKDVPLIKTKGTFSLNYNDMFDINKKLIKSKVNKMDSKMKGVICFNYDDYISLFLLLTSDIKKSYRAMDLIQANMNLRYEGGFTMNNCLQGFKVRSIFRMDSMFIQLPFVKDIVVHDIDKLKFEYERSYTY